MSETQYMFFCSHCYVLLFLLLEIGHNLGFDHAGVGSDEYGDPTGKFVYVYSFLRFF